MKRTFFVLAIVAAASGAAQAEPLLPVFDPANFDPLAIIDNPYLPLGPGFSHAISGQITDDGESTVTEISIQTYEGPGPVIAGVQSTFIRDRSTLDGVLVEEAHDYFAQDRDGNVWYLGEDVINLTYDDDEKVSAVDTQGSWRAGVNGAEAGFAMPALLQVGAVYFQEHAPADAAMDIGEILDRLGSITGPLGSYGGVVAVFETSPIEPDLREIKYYAPGVGLIRVWEGVDAQRTNPTAVFDLTRRD